MQAYWVLPAEQRSEQLISELWLQMHKHIEVGLLQEQTGIQRTRTIYFFFAQAFSYDTLLGWADCSFSHEEVVAGFLKSCPEWWKYNKELWLLSSPEGPPMLCVWSWCFMRPVYFSLCLLALGSHGWRCPSCFTADHSDETGTGLLTCLVPLLWRAAAACRSAVITVVITFVSSILFWYYGCDWNPWKLLHIRNSLQSQNAFFQNSKVELRSLRSGSPFSRFIEDVEQALKLVYKLTVKMMTW